MLCVFELDFNSGCGKANYSGLIRTSAAAQSTARSNTVRPSEKDATNNTFAAIERHGSLLNTLVEIPIALNCLTMTVL